MILDSVSPELRREHKLQDECKNSEMLKTLDRIQGDEQKLHELS